MHLSSRRRSLVALLAAVLLATVAVGTGAAPAQAAPPGGPGTPTTPTDFKIGIDPSLRVTFKWTPATSGPAPTKYLIYVTPLTGDDVNNVRIDVPAPASTAEWTGGVAGRRYFALLQAANDAGPSKATKEVFFTMPAAALTPTRPFANWNDVVTREHKDFIGREPTSAERAAAVATITAGSPNGSVLQQRRLAYVWSLAQRASVFDGPALRLYQAYFDRAPDQSGLTYWTGRLKAGVSLLQVSASFADSPEFKRTYGGLEDSGFVTLVYRNVLDRTPDDAGLAYWTGQLAQGRTTRAKVMVGFSESSEFKRRMQPRLLTTLVYFHMVKRMPLPEEIATPAANAEVGLDYFAKLYWKVLDSSEYLGRGRTP